MGGATVEPNWEELSFSSFDGLKLHAKLYPAATPSGLAPVVCLPGLTRNSQDFHYIATYLSQHPEAARDVYCLDYRGRGKSEYDSNWHNYTPMTELQDVLALTTIESIHKAVFIGTSRGGIIMMLMASARPTLIEATILNDIGPVIETEGLLRIRSYVGSTPAPKDWSDAAQIIETINKKQFPELTEDDWITVARQLFLEDNDLPVPSYDPDLVQSLSSIDITQDIPSMWPQFTALGNFPIMTIRGANSDILSDETLQKMHESVPHMLSYVVENEGHAPLLNKQAIHDVIYAFIQEKLN